MVEAQPRLKVNPLDIQVDWNVCNRAMPPLNIGAVAARAGVTTPTVRYYESIGLIPPPCRAANNYRHAHGAQPPTSSACDSLPAPAAWASA